MVKVLLDFTTGCFFFQSYFKLKVCCLYDCVSFLRSVGYYLQQYGVFNLYIYMSKKYGVILELSIYHVLFVCIMRAHLNIQILYLTFHIFF